MNDMQNIIKSFEIQDTLNPKVWDNFENPSEAKLKSNIRGGLLDVADNFVEYLGEDIFVDDVMLTGSLSNFNWSKFSDFDLHIIIDFEQFGEDAELYKELFDLKKQLYNDKHDIRIKGYDVELYAQDLNEPHVSSGEYSVKNDEWIRVPKKQKIELDEEHLKNKIKSWVRKIDNAIEEGNKENLEKIKDKLKEYRQSGLEKNGELSYENLVFKFLRRSGHIEKLFDIATKETDKELSIETRIEE